MLRLPAWCQRLSLTRVVRLAGLGPSGVGVCSTGWGLALPPHACPSVRGFFVAGRAARSSCEISSPTRHGASRSRTPARRAPLARSSCPRLLPRMVKSVLRRYHWRVDLRPPLFGAAWPGLADLVSAQVFIGPPAFDGAVAPHPAGVAPPGTDRGELPGRRIGLAKCIIIAPAFDGAVAPHPAGVAPPGADGCELPGRRRGLAMFIITPAFD